MRILAPSLASILAVLLPVAAAAQDAPAVDATVTPGNTLAEPPAEWLGATPHLVLMGTLGGRPVDIQLLDMGRAAGVAAFEGKREYLPGGDGAWRYGDFEVALRATVDGVEKGFEMELENRDFGDHALPATFELGGENFPEGARAFLEASAEWETAAGSVNDELGGWTGTLTLLEDSGTPDAEGLVPDGLIGGLMVAEREGDRLVMSFTVPVAGHEKDE